MNEKDNVAVALDDLNRFEVICVIDSSSRSVRKEIEIQEDIKFGHKVAVECIQKDNDIVKYGYCVGLATETINIGEHVHIHNIASKYMHGLGGMGHSSS